MPRVLNMTQLRKVLNMPEYAVENIKYILHADYLMRYSYFSYSRGK